MFCSMHLSRTYLTEKTMSVVLRPGKNQQWAYESDSLDTDLILARILEERIEGDASVNATICFAALVLEKEDYTNYYCCISEFLWQLFSSFQMTTRMLWNVGSVLHPDALNSSVGMPSRPTALPALVCLIAFFTSSMVGGKSMSVSIGF